MVTRPSPMKPGESSLLLRNVMRSGFEPSGALRYRSDCRLPECEVPPASVDAYTSDSPSGDHAGSKWCTFAVVVTLTQFVPSRFTVYTLSVSPCEVRIANATRVPSLATSGARTSTLAIVPAPGQPASSE